MNTAKKLVGIFVEVLPISSSTVVHGPTVHFNFKAHWIKLLGTSTIFTKNKLFKM